MGLKNFGNQNKGRERKVFNVPAVSGDYASEKITFGAVASGQPQESLNGVTALVEGSSPEGCFVELWLPKVESSGEYAGSFTDEDYFYSGRVIVAVGSETVPAGHDVSYGSATWSLAGYPAAQLRVKSGGPSGEVSVSASAN